jgi:hypothetical protein
MKHFRHACGGSGLWQLANRLLSASSMLLTDRLRGERQVRFYELGKKPVRFSRAGFFPVFGASADFLGTP